MLVLFQLRRDTRMFVEEVLQCLHKRSAAILARGCSSNARIKDCLRQLFGYCLAVWVGHIVQCAVLCMACPAPQQSRDVVSHTSRLMYQNTPSHIVEMEARLGSS